MTGQAHILLIDNFDSFTYNIWDYLSRDGAKVEVKFSELQVALSRESGSQRKAKDHEIHTDYASAENQPMANTGIDLQRNLNIQKSIFHLPLINTQQPDPLEPT